MEGQQKNHQKEIKKLNDKIAEVEKEKQESFKREADNTSEQVKFPFVTLTLQVKKMEEMKEKDIQSLNLKIQTTQKALSKHKRAFLTL